MSYLERLFPLELEALGNKWQEPAPKRRRIEVQRAKTAQTLDSSLRLQNGGLDRKERCLSLSASVFQQPRRLSVKSERAIKSKVRAQSESQVSTIAVATQTGIEARAVNSSCLPSFIEPSILRNYLSQVHPKDSHRYLMQQNATVIDLQARSLKEESVSSPGSLVADTSSPASIDSCPSPAAICDQFRSGPFGHVFAGLRFTDNERDLVEDLLRPDEAEANDKPRTTDPEIADIELAVLHSCRARDEQLLREIFPPLSDKEQQLFKSHCGQMKEPTIKRTMDNIEKDEDYPVHKGFVVSNYDAPDVDDFFDLEEACT